MSAKNETAFGIASAEGGLMSSIEQFDAPLDCPNTHVPYLLGMNKRTARAVIFRPRCKMWSCPTCGPLNAWVWSFRANAGAHQLYDSGRKLTFMTITSSNKISGEQSWWVAPRAWMKLQARIRRKFGTYEYFVVPEVQERGHVHFHGIFAVAIGARWLKDNAAQCGFGYMDDAQEVWSAGGVVGYVNKYLVKSLAVEKIPPRTRRVRTSRGWPKSDPREPPQDWEFHTIRDKTQITDLYHGLIASGYATTFAGHKTAWMFVEMSADA